MGRGPVAGLGPSPGPAPSVTADDPTFLALREGFTGRVLVGGSGQRYTVDSLRSEGGQGWVFLATVSASGQSALTVGQTVVVKVLRADALSHEARVRFHREAHVLRLLSEEHSPCAHVVRFHDYSEHEIPLPEGGSMLFPFTVLEYVRGSSLDQEIQAGPLPLARVRTILRHIAAGLEYVHVRGVVHRDLKPANVLLSGHGPTEQAKITDFGLVRIVSPDLARTARIAGASVGYAPPEQYERGNARVSPRTDVFSVAAVAFELLTGAPAYPYRPGDPPMPVLTKILAGTRPRLVPPVGSPLAAAPGIVRVLEQEIHRALSPEPDARQATVRELVEALERQLAQITPSSHELPAFTGVAAPSSARWLFRGTSARLADSEPPWKAAVFGPQGRHALALGDSSFYLVSVENILPQEAPHGLDVRVLTGLRRLHDGALLVYGHGGLVGSVTADLGVFRPLPRPSRSVSFQGALVVDDRVVGFGRYDGGRAAVVTYRQGQLVEELELDAPEILSASCTLGGTLVLGTRQGWMLQRAPGAAFVLRKLCDADLLAISCDDERIFLVGSGGHALAVDERGTVALEPVQTTRDLHLLQIEGGVAWTAGAEGRILFRDRSSGAFSSWIRADGAAFSAGIPLALHVRPRLIEVLWSDGTFTRGTLLEDET